MLAHIHAKFCFRYENCVSNKISSDFSFDKHTIFNDILIGYLPISTNTDKRNFGSGMKPKVRAGAAELNAEPELFQFKANIHVTYLIKSKALKYHILAS